MDSHSTQQEILVMTGTSFSSRQWCEKTDSGNNNYINEKDKLQDACWNGLMRELLPELFTQPAGGKGLYLWQIWEASSFLGLDLGEFPMPKDKFYSIDPYSFLVTQSNN